MKYRLYSNSEKSYELNHENNEDSYLFTEFSFMKDKKIKLLIIADGMGGLTHGDIASKNAIAGFVSSFYNDILQCYLNSDMVNFSMKYAVEDMKKALVRGIQAANTAVCTGAEAFQPTGSTISVVCIIDDCVVSANVGDSPIYLYKKSENNIRLISKLQTKSERESEAGYYKRNSDEYHKNSHILYCSLGQYSKLSTEDICVSVTGQLEAGDAILMGSDGCFGYTSDSIIKQMLCDCKEPEEGFILPQLFELSRVDKNDDQTALLYINARGEE